MDEETKLKLKEQGEKIDAIYKSVEKTRKYFQMIFWITILTIVLPLVGMIFVIPKFLGIYSSYSALLGGGM